MLKNLLLRQNYTVDHCETMALAFEAILNNSYDLVILDRGLPDGEGLDLIRKLVKVRRKLEIPPFLVLSARGETRDLVDGLDAGAVDYITKPYEPDELLARIRANTRKSAEESFKVIALDNLTYLPKKQDFAVNGKVIHLPRRQFVILDLLMRNPKTVVSYERLEAAVYGYDDDIISNSIASQISRLRTLLKEAKANVRINVFRGRGYILEVIEI